jgi:hypothetical protein
MSCALSPNSQVPRKTSGKALIWRTSIGKRTATLLTQIARDVRAPDGTGAQLLQHAWALARRSAGEIAATVLALDPYDSQTAQMWINRWGFRDSAGPGPGGHERRLWIPLASSASS